MQAASQIEGRPTLRKPNLWKAIRLTVAGTALAAHANASAAAPPPAFERNLRRAIAIRGAEQARFSLAERMAHYRVPGVSVAVIDGCRIADSRGFGRSAGNGPPITPRTLFQAGSISKSVTAVAALRLVGEGKIPLESDVRPLVKSWAADSTADARAHPVTLRQLLNHSAGVTEMGGKGYVRGTPLPAIAEIVNGKTPANNPPVRIEREPGTSWAYSSGGYHVVQALMEEATGEPFALLAERLVLRPAKMRDSTFAQPLEPARLPLAASAAGPDGSPLEGSWRVNPELAAGGLWTNPTDFARFLIALTNDIRGGGNRLLGPRMSREMFSPGLSNWGLGVQLNAPAGPRRIGHTGHNVGFVSEFVIYPDTCQGAVVMTNADQGGWLAPKSSTRCAISIVGRKPRLLPSKQQSR